VIAGQVVVPPGISWIGVDRKEKIFVAGANEKALGSTMWVTNVTSFPVIKFGTGQDGRTTGGGIKNVNFSHGATLMTAGPYAGSLLEFTGTSFVIEGCVFSYLGYETVLKGTLANAIRVERCSFLSIGDYSSQRVMPPATPGDELYTWGTAIDFGNVADSFIIKTVIQGVGQYGAIIGGNTKVEGCFIDLCRVGLKVTNNRCQIIGSNVKWNMTDGVQLDGADGVIISGNVIMGNNYFSYATAATAGYAIRFTGDPTKYFLITSNNMVDNYESYGAAAFKTVRQGGIQLGAIADNSGIISGNIFSNPDAAWDATLTDNNPIIDGAGEIVNGHVLFTSNLTEAGGSTGLRHTPFVTATGTTLGTLIKRIVYRDKNGVKIGDIPIYDNITS